MESYFRFLMTILNLLWNLPTQTMTELRKIMMLGVIGALYCFCNGLEKHSVQMYYTIPPLRSTDFCETYQR